MSEPKIVCVDLETLPDLNEVLKVWPGLSNYPGLTLKATINSIICFGYREFGVDAKAKCISAWDFKNWTKDVNDDYEVVKAARAIIADADALISHNGKRFDLKFFNTRLAKHGLEPLHKMKHIDTCQKAKQHYYLFNNKLDTLGKWFADEEKMDHEGWPLWVKVHGGLPRVKDEDAEQRMTKYCKQDVDLTTKVFKVLRPHCNEIPNYNLFTSMDVNVCTHCGSTRIKRDGHTYTKTTVLKRWRCKDCYGAMTESKKNKTLKPV